MSGTVGAKYDLGNGHTEPSPRLFNTTDNRIGGRGKMQLKYRLCGCKCRLNNRKKRDRHLHSINYPWHPGSLYLLARLTPICLQSLLGSRPPSSTCSDQTPASSKVLATLNPTLVRLPWRNALLLRAFPIIVLASPFSNTSTSLNQALQIFTLQAQNSANKKFALCCGSTTLTFWPTYASLFAIQPN